MPGFRNLNRFIQMAKRSGQFDPKDVRELEMSFDSLYHDTKKLQNMEEGANYGDNTRTTHSNVKSYLSREEL